MKVRDEKHRKMCIVLFLLANHYSLEDFYSVCGHQRLFSVSLTCLCIFLCISVDSPLPHPGHSGLPALKEL